MNRMACEARLGGKGNRATPKPDSAPSARRHDTSDILRQHWQGVPSEEIGANLERQRTAEEVDAAVEKEGATLEGNAVDRIIQRAEAGKVAAVEWLEKRGFINMPCNRSQ